MKFKIKIQNSSSIFFSKIQIQTIKKSGHRSLIAFSTGCTGCALTELVSCRSHGVSAQQIQWFTLIVNTDRCRDLLCFFVNLTLPPSSAVLHYLTNVDVSDTPHSSTVVSHTALNHGLTYRSGNSCGGGIRGNEDVSRSSGPYDRGAC